MVESYEQAGVQGQGEALSAVIRHLGPTLDLPHNTKLLTSFGHYASVMGLSDEIAIAFSTDGVGSKTLIASALDRYDTIGFDCVAMNVNDVICVGARPLAMVDYLGVHTLDARRADEILRGLGAAAKEASIAIPGGELAQLPEVIGSDGKSPGDPKAFDLVGTCIGVVHPDEVILGADVRPGDALIGIASSGIHSNGLTLARKTLLGRHSLEEQIPTLGCSLGEELLRPTEIYVRAITALWDANVQTRGLVHVTSDGFANLCRLESSVGYRIDELFDRPAIFDLIKEVGSIDDEEMYRVFNMGVGFIAIVPAGDQDRAVATIEEAGYRARVLGRVTDDVGVVEVVPAMLRGGMRAGESFFERI